MTITTVIQATGATRADIAWAAGLFEGEGNIYTYPNNNGMTLTVSMTDEDVIRRFKDVVGVGRITGPYQPKRANTKPVFHWRAASFEHAQAVVAMFWSFLLSRRQGRARDALLSARGMADRRFRVKGQCKQGHLVVGGEFYTDKRGRLVCRECKKQWSRLAYRRNRNAQAHR